LHIYTHLQKNNFPYIFDNMPDIPWISIKPFKVVGDAFKCIRGVFCIEFDVEIVKNHCVADKM